MTPREQEIQRRTALSESRVTKTVFPFTTNHHNTLFGGTAEYAALWMKHAGMEDGFYWYVTAMIAVSLIVYLRMPDTRKTSQI